MIARVACGILLGLVALQGSFALAAEREWGTLRGQFVLDGPAPEPRDLDTNGNKDVGKIPAQDLVVDANGGVAHIAVFLRNKPGVKWPVHPDYLDPRIFQAATILAHDFRFEPRVTTVQVEQEIIVANSDPKAHNPILTSRSCKNRTFQAHLEPDKLTRFRLQVSQGSPLSLQDNYFPWMQAYVLVRDNPYVAVTNSSGKFELKNLPAGLLEFKVWHEGQQVDKATLGGQPVEWKAGVATFEIKPGMNDLGKILVKLERKPER